jgi:PIN domain nuclease of toxin-antitoxin system
MPPPAALPPRPPERRDHSRPKRQDVLAEEPGAKWTQTDTWSISAIVLWELAKLAQLDRIDLDLGDADVTRALSALHTWPIDLQVSVASTRLDFRRDPADELIAATSIVHGVPLMTRDRRIKRSRIVPFA